MADVACEEYASTLKDLTFNSKPHISMLTMLAEENQQYAPKIVQAIEAHLQKVRPETKLPAIYLIDSIVKNVGGDYLALFTQNLVSTFCSVFEKVDERTRIQLFKLRQTWSDVFPTKKLHAIDVRVRQMDPAWPVVQQASIHVNPKFLKTAVEEDTKNNQEIQEAEMRKQLIAKQQELLKLQQQKLELELLQTKAKLHEQKKLLHPPADPLQPVPIIKPVQCVEEPPPIRKIVMDPPKPHIPPPVKSAIVMPPHSSIPGPSTRPQSVVIPTKDPRLMRDPRLLRDTRSFHAALVPVNAGPIPAVPVINNRNNEKMVEKAHVNLNVLSNHVPRSGNERGMPIRETVKSAVVVQPARSAERKDDPPSVKNDKTPKKKPEKETKKCSPKSNVKLANISTVKEGAKKDTKKKNETPSPKKIVPHKKDELLKEKVDKPKPTEKNKKTKVEGKVALDPLRERKGSGRNSAGRSSVRPAHEYKNEDFSGKGNNRARRNYRTNRNRSDSPDNKLGRQLKPVDKDNASTLEKDRSGVRARSRSPLRPDRANERDDKRAERSSEKEEKKKKGPRTEIENVNSGVADKDTQSAGLKDLNTDVDLRTINPNSPKHTDKSMNSDVDAKENIDASSAAEEPPPKKLRQDEAQLDTLFGSKDQDYRQMPPNSEIGVPELESPGNRSWAQYKAEHPEEFKCSTPRPLKESVQREPYGFSSFDQDFRTSVRDDDYYPQVVESEQQPKFSGFQRGRNRRGFPPNQPRMRGFGRGRYSGRHVDDPRVLRRHPVYQRLYSQQENTMDPNLDIPHALLLSKQAEILKQADQQLKSGHLSREQHHELLNQLGKLYELQTLRQKQKEEELREKIFLRNDVPRRDCPPWESESSYPGGPRFPPDSGNKHFAAVQEPSTGIDPYQKKLNRRHMRHKMVKSRQSEVLDSVAAELEHVQRSSQSGEVSRLDATKEKAMPLKEETSLTEARQTEPHFRNITIDGKLMRLMFYGTVAVVLSDGETPREITFKGRLQEVYVDEVTIPLGFGGDTVIAEVDGKPHSFKFGAPTEEIFIDNIPHAIQFGGPPKPIFLGGKQRMLRLSGPAPDVEFAKLRPALQGEVTKLLQLEGKLRKEKATFGSNDTKSKGTNVPCEEPRTTKGEVDERPKVKVENPDTAPKPAPPLIDVEPKKPERVPEQVEVKELVVKDDASKATVREPVPEPDKARDLHNPDPKLFEEIPVKNEKCDVDLRITEPLETAPKPSTSTHRASPIPVPAVASLTDSERVVRTASPSHFVDASSRSPVYHGSFANVSRPDYHEFRAVHSEEGDKDYRDIRTFSQVDSMVFKEESMEPKFAPQDKPHDPWPEPWRENTRMYHDVPVFKSEHPQPGGYGQHEPPPHRDEYVPEYWPPHRREEEFQGKPRFFRERRSRQNSPQRVQPEYPPFRDSGPLPLPHDGGMHRDFPLYRPNPNMGNRVDNVRPHFEPLRPPFELPAARYDMPRPRFENPIRPSLGERGPILQPPLSFYPSGPTNIQRPGFPEQRPEFFQPMTDRTNFAPVSNVFPAGTPINQGGLPSVPPPPVLPPPPVPQPFVLPPQLDVAELFKKLVTAGIISKSTSTTSAQENASDSAPDVENKENVEVAEVEEEKIPHIEFTSESLRTHYSGVISNLFRGIQCSSCGLRFTSDQTEKYAQHLDWHFRQNRRERDGAKKAVSRKWYYDVQDWIQFEEIEDMEERARSLFEVQANEEIVEHIDDLHTVPVGENDEDNTCVVCGEPFEQFWDQEKEEWHLRDSFRVENKTYHPGCYEDIKNVALTEPSSEAVPPEKPVCVSWQDMPDKKKTDEKKKTEEKKPEAPEDKTAAVSVVKIKQEKIDVAELEEPTEPMEVDIPEAVVIKQERDLDTVAAVSGPSEIPFTNEPPVILVSGTSSEQPSIKTIIPTPHASVPLKESLAVEPLTTQPSESFLVDVVQEAVMSSDETSAAVPPLDEVANVVPPYEGTPVASPGEAMVIVPPNETVASAPFGEATRVKSPDGAVPAAPPDEVSRFEPPDEAMADAPPEGSGGDDLPLQLPSEDNPPVDLSSFDSTAGLVPVVQVTTDSSPVDEMQRLQVKVEPEEFTSLLSTSETGERNVELEANSTPSLETNSMHSSTIKQQHVENDERTLSPPIAVQIKQEPVEHEEITPSELSVDRTKAETGVQKPHSPVGGTIEKVLEGSCEVESSVEDTVAPTPGFTVFPPVMRGTELSGLCSIM